MVFGKFNLRRRQELASYTPARAGREDLEPAVGSYKPIMHKEDVALACSPPVQAPQGASLPDVLANGAWGTRHPEESTPPSTHSSPRPSPPHSAVSLSFALDYKGHQPTPILVPDVREKEQQSTPHAPETELGTEMSAVAVVEEAKESPPEEPQKIEPQEVQTAEESAPPEQPQSPPARRVAVSPRRRLTQEFHCEMIRCEIIARIPVDHPLLSALTIPTDFKRATDYLKGLFEIEVLDDPANINDTEAVEVKMVPIKENGVTKDKDDVRNRKMPSAPWDIKSEKMRLCHGTERLLEVLRAREDELRAAAKSNEATVEILIKRLSSTNISNKLKVHAAEIGHITALLAALASRLARTHNAISIAANEATQDKVLIAKRDKLEEQMEEAKLLKENIDKKATTLSALLLSELNKDEMNEYKQYINNKTKLLLDVRDVQDTIEVERQRLVKLKETTTKR